jgi:hypothetical protein
MHRDVPSEQEGDRLANCSAQPHCKQAQLQAKNCSSAKREHEPWQEQHCSSRKVKDMRFDVSHQRSYNKCILTLGLSHA